MRPVALLQLEEPLLLLGREKFMGVDIRVRVKGGGHVSQIYGECTGGFWCIIAFFLTILSVNAAIRQAVSKSLIAYYQKCKLVVIVVVIFTCTAPSMFLPHSLTCTLTHEWYNLEG